MRINNLVIKKVANARDFKAFAEQMDIQSQAFVIKPNWSNANTFTSAQTLEWLFECLDGKKVVIEGYTALRNELNTGLELRDVITPSNARKKWKWIKKQDQWFLEYSGIGEVLKKYDVEYVNITEEVWSGRVAETEDVRNLVESRFGPIINEEMYSFVPQKVYDFRDCVLISLNNPRKTQEVMSTSTKNIFGLIPDPARYGKWHGKNDSRLPQSIVNINKIYRSLFTVNFWINEIKEMKLFVGCGQNSILADAATAVVLGFDPKKIMYLNHAAKVFGGYDDKIISKVRAFKETSTQKS